MRCIHITEVKKFMGRLLMSGDFDAYLLSEAEIVTFNLFKISGQIQKKFYSKEEYESLGSPLWSEWGKIRPLCFEIIKGSRTPLRFKIVLRQNDKEIEKLMQGNELSYTLEDIGGLYLNFVYENNTLNCITGTSMNLFTMDKSLEQAWDQYAEQMLSIY